MAVMHAARRPLSPGAMQQRLAGPAGRPGAGLHDGGDDLVAVACEGRAAARRAGRGYLYAPVSDDAGLAGGRMRQVLDREADREAVLARFVSGLSGRDEELLVLFPGVAQQLLK